MAAVEYALPSTPPEQHISQREKVAATFKSLSGLLKAIVTPLPSQTGDGSLINKPKPTGFLHDIVHMHPDDIFTLGQLTKEVVTGDPVNDKTFLMERVVKLASELPLISKFGGALSDRFIQRLYDDLQHPPIPRLGDAHKYRAADGSFNVSVGL
jgi:linoleate 8R-lipoxygenase/9,12-octadecadienoate 8-hydroperoxide 8R-isomerase